MNTAICYRCAFTMKVHGNPPKPPKACPRCGYSGSQADKDAAIALNNECREVLKSPQLMAEAIVELAGIEGGLKRG